MKREDKDLVDIIENEIRKAMERNRDDYNIGIIDGLIKAINIIEG